MSNGGGSLLINAQRSEGKLNVIGTSSVVVGEAARITGDDLAGTVPGGLRVGVSYAQFAGGARDADRIADEPATQIAAQDVDVLAAGNFRMVSESDFKTNVNVHTVGGSLLGGGILSFVDNIVDVVSNAIVGTGARIEAETVDINAVVGRAPEPGEADAIGGDLSMTTYARAAGGALFGFSEANAETRLFADAVVLVEGLAGPRQQRLTDGTLITGRRGTDLEARFGKVTLDEEAQSLFIGIGASRRFQFTDFFLRPLVDGDQGATIFTAPRLVPGVSVHPADLPATGLVQVAGFGDLALFVNADPGTVKATRTPSNPDGSAEGILPARSTVDYTFGVDTGVEFLRPAITIEWDSDVEISAGPSPELVIDAGGDVQRAYNVKLIDGSGNAYLPAVGSKAVRPYRVLWVVAVMIGSVATLPVVWSFADIANGMMAVPNLVSLLALNGVLVAETKKYLTPGNLEQVSPEE